MSNNNNYTIKSNQIENNFRYSFHSITMFFLGDSITNLLNKLNESQPAHCTAYQIIVCIKFT